MQETNSSILSAILEFVIQIILGRGTIAIFDEVSNKHAPIKKDIFKNKLERIHDQRT